MKNGSFKPRQYNNVIIGGLFVVLGIILLFAKESSMSISIPLILIGALTILNTLMARLVFIKDSVTLKGLLPKKIKYQDIAKIEWNKVWYKSGAGAGDAACIIITSQKGKRLRLLPNHFSGYEGKNGWAALILKVANKYGVSTDDEVTQRLKDATERSSSQPRSLV